MCVHVCGSVCTLAYGRADGAHVTVEVGHRALILGVVGEEAHCCVGVLPALNFSR
jgi:hypothetical protein